MVHKCGYITPDAWQGAKCFIAGEKIRGAPLMGWVAT